MNTWEEEIELPNKEANIEFAYILNSNPTPIECDKEKLLYLIETNDDLKFVTTPQNDTFVIPGSDFETLQPILRKKKLNIQRNLKWAIGYTLLFGGLMSLTNLNSEEGFWADRSGKLNILIFGIIPIIDSLYDLFSIRKINHSNYFQECLELKFDYWINNKKQHSIYIITGILIFVTLLQFITGLNNSIELTGLVKPNTLNGEYWRLLTCTLLHGSILHILFNSVALFVIGKMVIRISNFYFFAIVFLGSGIIGSLFSLFLMPNATSVGASGGIMGLIGFILIMSIQFKDNIPRNIIKSMLNTIILVIIIGISAPVIIDNAAHGGGLIGGILIGLLLISKQKKTIPYKPNLITTTLGILSTLILITGIAIIMIKLI